MAARPPLRDRGAANPTVQARGEHVCAGRAVIAARSARTRGAELYGQCAGLCGGANGEGQTAEEAVADLREALDGWFAEFGVPDELTITVRDVA